MRAGEAGGRSSRKKDSPRPTTRRRFIYVLVYLAIASAVVGGRGLLLAHLTGGRYLLSSFVVESLSFIALLATLKLLECGVRWGLRRAIQPRRWWQHVLEKGIYVTVMLLGLLPFLLAALFLHPQRVSCRGTPRQAGLPFREVAFESRGNTLSGWFIPGADEAVPVVLVTHGLNANKENFLFPVALLREKGLAAFIFDFPAHGDSEGRLITFGALESEDVKAAHDWIAREWPGRPIYALGYSMGGAAVIGAAADHGIFERVVIDCSFSSMKNVAMASTLRPFGPLKGPIWSLGCFWGRLWSGVDFREHRPGDVVAKVARRPLLLIHGRDDRLIPCSESVRLHEKTGGRADLWLVDHAGHAGSMRQPGYASRLADFFGMPRSE